MKRRLLLLFAPAINAILDWHDNGAQFPSWVPERITDLWEVAPTNGRVQSFRFWLIDKLAQSPRYCWADLVTWATWARPDCSLLPRRDASGCNHPYPPGECCWCGKFGNPSQWSK